MIFDVERIPVDAWRPMSENAHLVVFGKHKPVCDERIDFACLIKGNGALMAYATGRELDGESLYWQFGGAFPGAKNSSLSFKCYLALIDWSKQHYARISTLIENDNLVMLKMAMKVGYRIVGIRTFKGSILLEHLLEFDK